MRLVHVKGLPEANWGYVFPRGPVDDTTPTISITRTSAFYTVVSWDLLELATEGSFPEYSVETIDEALASVRSIVASRAGTQVYGVWDLES